MISLYSLNNATIEEVARKSVTEKQEIKVSTAIAKTSAFSKELTSC